MPMPASASVHAMPYFTADPAAIQSNYGPVPQFVKPSYPATMADQAQHVGKAMKSQYNGFPSVFKIYHGAAKG